jgi:hypothetical protein
LLEAGDEQAPAAWAWRGLVTRNRKYVEFAHGRRLLFDFDADPRENHNVASARPVEVDRLHGGLARLKPCVGDSCRVPNPL